jgi:alpha-methylacyl-CoA racemase
MTGWGQNGMYGPAAGHDINYISLAGALKHFGRAGETPTPPLNMVGDFGGGGMFLALGVVAALLEAQKSGKGQVVDTAMVDGTAVLMTMFWAMKNVGMFNENEPGTNLLDTGAHFYDVYKCKDGEYISLGSIEPQFYAELMRLTGLEGDAEFAKQMDKSQWPHLKARLTEVFAAKTQREWCDIMEATFVEHGGVMQPSPAPRFSRTQSELTLTPAHAGQHTREVLEICGFAAADIDALVASGAVKEA